MKICARAIAMLLFTFCFLSITPATVDAQVFESPTHQAEKDVPGDITGGQDSVGNKPGGYIRDFFEKRSGERGVGGFITWMLSSQAWIDLFRYITGGLTGTNNDAIGQQILNRIGTVNEFRS